MVRKILIYFLLFYVLVLLQTSFLIHFDIFLGRLGGWSPNFVLITVLLLNLLEKANKNDGVIAAFLGGFFLDTFSSRPIGFHIFILLGLAIFIKLILKKYAQVPKVS